jgi:hypothetical protein
MELVNLDQKTPQEIIKGIEEEIRKGSHASPPLNGFIAVLQMKVIERLCSSIDQFRESSDDSSKAMKRWTIVLVGATVVLAAATVVLAIATIKLALG